jgi:hypothetical protein
MGITGGGRLVIHGSILGLAAPHGVLDSLAGFIPPGAQAPPDPPTKIVVAGMSDPRGGGTSQTLVFDLSSNPAEGAASVPHIAAYATDLRPLLGTLQGVRQPTSTLFAEFYRLWREGNRRWPRLNRRELDEPFEARLLVNPARGRHPERRWLNGTSTDPKHT